MIESLFFDFDGTLQGFENHELSESTIDALHKLKKNNKKIYIATGRNLSDMPESIFEIGFDGYINNNGSVCSDTNKNIFFTEYIPSDDIKALLEYDEQNPIAFSYMTKNNPFSINRINENIEKSFKLFNLDIPEVIDPKNLPLDNVIQMNLFVNQEEEDFLLNNVLKNCVGTRWIEYFADINPKNINKMEGIKKIAKYDNLDLSKTMSFGDGGNDMKMIQGCKIGVAMGNANDDVKVIADYVTTSVDENGIWNALKYYNLI